MKILIVASYNKKRFSPFIVEQARALQELDIEVEWFGIEGKGIRGYLKALPRLKQKIRDTKPQVIHAHFGLSGLLANLQRQVPVVTTYHGSDINNRRTLPLSRLSIILSRWNIFVSERCMRRAISSRVSINKLNGKKSSLIPCGVNLTDDQLTCRDEARRTMGLNANRHYVLFAGAFDVAVKNADLAKASIELLRQDEQYRDVELLELRGYTRHEVTLLMCAADALLLTSHTEGSPQVVKEAMACGCPIVSVDVGDVRERVTGIEGCYVAQTREPQELALLLKDAMIFRNDTTTKGMRTLGRDKILEDQLTNYQVAQMLLKIYNTIGV